MVLEKGALVSSNSLILFSENVVLSEKVCKFFCSPSLLLG